MSLARLALSLSLCAAAAAGLRADAGRSESAKGSIQGRVTIAGGGALQKPDLSRAVAYLASHPELDRSTTLMRDAAIGQRNRTFVPDLLVVPRGTGVEFPNWDPFSHNVFSRSRTAQFDLDRYPQGQSKRYAFEEVGVVQVFCNIHPEMKALIVVVPNGAFARADKDGRFQLTGMPAGEYELVIWHERCDEQRRRIRVEPGQSAEISLTLKENRRSAAANHPGSRRARPGVERGLSVKREVLKLPVVKESHPAPPRSRPR